MLRGVLVPLDGSELAEIAVPYAQMLAARGSEITLLHVCETSHSQYDHMHRLYIEKMVEEVKRGAARYVRDKGAEIKVKSVILTGRPAEQIVDYAEKEEVKIIIIGSHGWSGVRRWVMGDVANKVVKATKKPVAIIRAGTSRTYSLDTPTKVKMMVPLDGSQTSEKILPYVAELATKVGVEVHLFYVAVPVYPGEFTPSTYHEEPWDEMKAKIEKYLKKVADRLSDKGISVKYDVGSGDAADEIIRKADDIDADLVAMTTRGHSGFMSAALGSTAEKVLNEGHQPLILVRE